MDLKWIDETPSVFQTISLSDRFASLVRSSSELSLVTPPSFAISVFHVHVQADDAERKDTLQSALTGKLYKRLEARKDIVLTKTVLCGKFCIRLAVGSSWTEERHIDAAYQAILSEARMVVAENASLQ